MQRTVLVLCVAALALAAPAPQYRGDGTSKRTSPARYQNRPSGDDSNQQYSQKSTRQPTQPAAVARSPTADRGNQQYSQKSTRQLTQPAPVVRTPFGNGGSQQYSGDASSKRTPPVAIIRYQNSPTGDGGNQHAYKTGNGIEREEGVFIKELTVTDDNGKQTTVKIPVYRGSYKYQQPDGTFIEVQYEADETGFHAVGDSIPQALQ